jgi:peptidoglycan/LPS O-acetylase OafA/YrhL
MFNTCEETWWANLLFISNVYPWFQPPNEGCYFWAWQITVEMQLTLLVPPIIIIYNKSPKCGHFIILLGNIVCIAQAVFTAYKYKLKAGPLAYENWNLFAYMFMKPWAHLGPMLNGIYAGWLYMQIRRYRLEDAATKKKEYCFIHLLYKRRLLTALMFFIGFSLIMFSLLWAHEPIIDAYAWSEIDNLLYFGF